MVECKLNDDEDFKELSVFISIDPTSKEHKQGEPLLSFI